MSHESRKPPRIVRVARRLRLRRMLTATVLAAATALIAARLVSEARQNSAISVEIARLEQEAGDIEERNAEIRSLIEGLSGTSVAEREARLKLGLRRPGEKVVIIESPAKPAEEGEESPPGDVGNPARWWYYFFDRERLAALAAKP